MGTLYRQRGKVLLSAWRWMPPADMINAKLFVEKSWFAGVSQKHSLFKKQKNIYQEWGLQCLLRFKMLEYPKDKQKHFKEELGAQILLLRQHKDSLSSDYYGNLQKGTQQIWTQICMEIKYIAGLGFEFYLIIVKITTYCGICYRMQKFIDIGLY